jgi:hypothetical protein
MNDIGMLFVQLAGLRRVAVSLLSDGERDDPRRRIGHPRDQALGVGPGDLGSKDRADHPVLGARAGTGRHRVEAILRSEGFLRV